MLVNTYTSIENWRIFISAVPTGHMHHLFSLNGLCAVTCSSAELMMSLLSCWLHVNLFFSAVLNGYISYFPVTSRTHTGSRAFYYWALQHWPLPIFSVHDEILVLCYSGKTWKNLLALTSVPPELRAEALSSVPCHLQPTFFSTGSSVQCPWNSHLLSVILYTVLNFMCICLFFQNGLQMMFCITQLRRTLSARMYSWPLSLTRNILS